MGRSTTTAAGSAHAPRFMLRAAGGLASNAGLHPRPWLARLRRALREDAFVLHFQPIVGLADGAISHREALVRLADEPDGRLLAPGAFLPAAERYGLVREIDRLVVSRVAALLGAARALDGSQLAGSAESKPVGSAGSRLAGSAGSGLAGPGASRLAGGVALNLSALSVTDRGMLAHIERELARNDADPRRLVVEITETAAISDMRRARAFCVGVQSLGCTIALDDFGVGFGSFYYAKRLPFGFLKIDGDFVRELPASRNDRLVVKAIVDVARGMGRRTIAEFVGDDATLDVLRELGVDYAQGFHVGRPAPLLA
jgi:EAL domain-containing protein (putative c-di-GMP-specific phosphodiesterase class I)